MHDQGKGSLEQHKHILETTAGDISNLGIHSCQL